MSGPWEDYQQPSANPWDEYAAAPAMEQGNAVPDPGILANAARALRMGLPFGNQFVAAEKTVLPQALGGSPGFDYGQNLADVNAADARLQQQHPIIANLGQGTGAAIGALAVPTAALGEGAQGLGMLGRSIRGGLAGASVGAIQGAGAPGSDIRNIPQTEEGAVGGLYTGGALGSAFPAIGAGIGAAYNAVVKPEVNMLAAALHGISPEEMTAAQALMQDAANRGIRLTSAEAIQQASGGATDLGRLQRIVEGTKGGASVMAPFMAARPEQVQKAVADALNRIAPAPVDPSLAPGMTGNAGQKAATDAIMAAERARTAAVTPLYEAAGKDTVPLDATGSSVRTMTPQEEAEVSANMAFPFATVRPEPDAALPDTFSIFGQDGKRLGIVRANMQGNNLNIDNVYSSNGEPLGASVMRDVLSGLREIFPEAETVGGKRVTGSRRETAPYARMTLPQQGPSGDMTDPLGSLSKEAAVASSSGRLTPEQEESFQRYISTPYGAEQGSNVAALPFTQNISPPRKTLNGARLTIDEAPAYISSDNVLNVRKIGNDEPDVFSDTPRMTRTYNIDDDAGRDHGVLNLNYEPEQKNIRVLSMEVRNLADGLSRENAQRILDQVHRDYPEAETISGMRITGSRSGTRPDTKIRLRPLSLTAPATRPQVPSGNMNDFLDSLSKQADKDKTGIVGPKLLQLRNDLLESKGSPAVPATRAPVIGPDGQVIRYETTPSIDAIPPKPLTDLESLDRVRKYHRDILDLPQIGQDAITKEQNAAVSNALGRLNDLMEANSKPFVAAKQKFQELTARDVAPAAAGPLGKIAATPELRTQTNALFPNQPFEGAPQETARAIAALNQQDPNIAAQLARQHLASNFAERAQQNIPGENQWGGAKFAAHITGNPLQADVLNQGLGALPHGATVAPDVNALLEALRATGKRQAPGSLTAQNTLDLKDLAAPGAIGTALHAAHSPVSAIPAIIAQLGDAATRARLYGHSAALARALTADPVGAFNAIAATRPVQRPVSRAAMAAALAANADLQAQRNQAIAP